MEKQPAVSFTVQNKFSRLPGWAPLATILAVAALVYSTALFNDFVKIDDGPFILKNQLINRNFNWAAIADIFSHFQNGKYQPLVNFSFLLEHGLFGFNPLIFHLTNVLLHLLSTFILYKFTMRFSKSQVTALVVAALFALHPMHVEEVAWASERKDLLYTPFFFLAMVQYLQYIDSGLQLKWLVAVFVLFLMSIFSKTTAMTLPAVLLLIDVYKGRKLDGRAWLEKAPFFLTGIVFAVLGQISYQSQGSPEQMPEAIHLVHRLFLFTYVWSYYLVTLAAPFGLSVMHYYPDVVDGMLPWQYYASVPFLLAVIAATAWVAVKRPLFRKNLLFGICFFVVTMAVMEQIAGVGPALTPERYTYVPYVGLFYIFGQWLSGMQGAAQRKALAVLSFFLLMFCVLTWQRIGVWRNTDTLFRDVVSKNAGVSESKDFYFLRGNTKVSQGDLQGALQDYDKAISIDPAYAEAYTNRGVIYFRQGDMTSALRDLNLAIAINPRRAKPYENRAAVKGTTGDFAGALSDFNHYLQIDSADSRVYVDRGMTRLSMGDTAGGCADFRQSSRLGNAEANQFISQFCH